MCYVVLAFFVFIIWTLTTQTDTRNALLVTPVWFIALGIAWLITRKKPEHLAAAKEFDDDLRAEELEAHRRPE